MTRDERKKVGNFFLCLESNFTQTLFSNVGNFLSRVGNFSFVLSQILCKRYSQMSAIFFISSRKFFPSSQVKCYANIILKCRQFFYLESEFFSFVSSQILCKCYSKTSAIFFISFENNVCVKFDSRRRKTFPTQNKKIAHVWE